MKQDDAIEIGGEIEEGMIRWNWEFPGWIETDSRRI
jgi:hypothetical protein